MTTRSGFADGCAADVLQIPITASTLGLSPLMRFLGSPVVGKSESVSTACTCLPAPMAYSVSVAGGESETMQLGFVATLAPPATMRGSANALMKSARVNRRDLK